MVGSVTLPTSHAVQLQCAFSLAWSGNSHLSLVRHPTYTFNKDSFIKNLRH